jgi:hypothetical protein
MEQHAVKREKGVVLPTSLQQCKRERSSAKKMEIP